MWSAEIKVRPARAAALLALALLGGCGISSTPAEERVARAERGEGDVVVAVVWPWKAHPEVRYGDGLQLAADEVNAAGGINGRRLRLLREDDGESVNQGLLVAQRLAENSEVVAVIGHLQSYVSVPAAAVYDMAGLVMLAPASTDPELTSKGYPRVFRSIFTDEDTGQRMADFAVRRGYGRVGIYYVRNSYGRTLANAFEERAAEIGLAVVARASHDPTVTQEGQALVTTLRDWERMELDAIFLAGQVPVAGQMIAQMRGQGIRAPILGGDAMSTPALIRAGGPAVEGTVVTASFHAAETRPAVQHFVAAFRKRYGAAPDPSAAAGYDAVKLLAHAMQRAGTSAPEPVARELHRLRGWKGVKGDVTFDEQGNLVAPGMVTLLVQDGQFELLPESTLAYAGSRPGVR
jgi:branched-chain amino acid transport system substrate-binding protein